MTRLGLVSAALLTAGLVAGSLADRAPDRPPVFAGGYRVLAADLHVHPFPLSASTLAAWDLAIEARHQGLDAIAIAGQNEAVSGRVGNWFANRFGGAIVIPSEEIHGPHFHMIAAGIRHTITWRLTARQTIDKIHRQGGVAIAAHPVASAWPAFLSDDAIGSLDATEVLQPISYAGERYASELREFYQQTQAAPVASSDYHGMGPVGFCRTYVFVQEASVQGILEAIRARRTVVLDGARVFGDSDLIRYAPGLPAAPAQIGRAHV